MVIWQETRAENSRDFLYNESLLRPAPVVAKLRRLEYTVVREQFHKTRSS